jgi:hypothetical protein
MYKDEGCEEPDSLKPILDRIISTITESLTGPDKAFYEREFKFFDQITSISGKLKPLVQADASKADKKVLVFPTFRERLMKNFVRSSWKLEFIFLPILTALLLTSTMIPGARCNLMRRYGIVLNLGTFLGNI